MTVKAILSGKGNAVVTVGPTTTLRDALKVLDEHRIGAVVVTDANDEIVGILSERDVVRTLARNAQVDNCRLCDQPVSSVMTRKVETCTESDTVYGIMDRMTRVRFRHLPVTRSGKLSGIISIGDVVKYRLEEMERESNALREYILTA